MTRRRKLLFGFLAAVLVLVAGAGWWGYARDPSPPFRIVARGASSSSDNLRVSSGNLVVVAPRPGVLFGTVTRPGHQEQFTYLILFRYGRPKSGSGSRGIQTDCRSDGRTAHTKDAIELDGKRIEAEYHIELNEKQTDVAGEAVTVGGKMIDLTAGQVFLIDLGAETPAYRQKKVELPAIASKLEAKEDVEKLAEAIRSSLESQDPEIKAFLR
jgi:hypothetical protein